MKSLKILLLATSFVILWWISLAQRWGVTGVTGVVLPWTTEATEAASDVLVIEIIQSAINRALGLLAFIALIILLYAWFLMLTAAGNEERYNKWRVILKQVALWLLFIGLAWIIVSMIFWIINWITWW